MDAMFGSAEVELPAAPVASDFATPEADSACLAAIGKLLGKASRPVVMAGGDVYWEHGENALRQLAEEVRCPVFMNGLGRGLLPADHELAFSRARSTAFKGADLVIVVGTPLDFRLGFGRFGEAQVVHVVDQPGRVGEHASLAASAAGNLAGALDGIRKAALEHSTADREPWIESLTGEEGARRTKEQELLSADDQPIHPVRIYGELAKRLDRDAIVIGDGGDFVSYAGKYVDTYVPGSFLDPGPYGCLGTGPGYALGAQLAHPDRQVVLMLGDGAAGFSIGDFDTLARFELPVVAVMGNNHCWGLEKHPMNKLYGYHVAAELSPEVRYDDVVTALGGAGRRVEKPGEIGVALDWALDQKGPVLLDIRTDPENEYPRSSVLG
jgi:acetolactate synthase-1/2/3 large subunit